jgi:dolichol kinase
VDSGYEDEGKEARLNDMPGPSTNGSANRDRSKSQEGLTEAEKQVGREYREGLRKRREDKAVARMVGGKVVKGGDVTRRERRKAKSWEIPRKVFHSSIGFMVLYLYVSETDLTIIVRNLGVFLGVVVTADVIRLNVPSFEWLYEKVLGFLMRESEREKVNGVVWYLIGVLFCLHFLPEDIACVSVMILSWADTAASVFGRLFGRYTPPLPSPPFATRKSLAGTIAASVVASLTAALFWATPIAEIGRRRLLANEGVNAIPTWILCIGSGLVGGIAEGLELGGVDDNLSLPILSALGIRGVVWAWKYFSSR